MVSVYVCGWYRGPKGDAASPEEIAANVEVATAVGCVLSEAGFAPLVPHIASIGIAERTHLSSEYWLSATMAWMLGCSCVVVISRGTEGCEGEIARAIEEGIPVFYSVDEFMTAYGEEGF